MEGDRQDDTELYGKHTVLPRKRIKKKKSVDIGKGHLDDVPYLLNLTRCVSISEAERRVQGPPGRQSSE